MPATVFIGPYIEMTYKKVSKVICQHLCPVCKTTSNNKFCGDCGTATSVVETDMSWQVDPFNTFDIKRALRKIDINFQLSDEETISWKEHKRCIWNTEIGIVVSVDDEIKSSGFEIPNLYAHFEEFRGLVKTIMPTLDLLDVSCKVVVGTIIRCEDSEW